MTVNKLNSQLKSNKPKNYEEEEELLNEGNEQYPAIAPNNFMSENEPMQNNYQNMSGAANGMSEEDQKIVNLKRQIDICQMNNEEMRRMIHEKGMEANIIRAELDQINLQNNAMEQETGQQPGGNNQIEPNSGQPVSDDVGVAQAVQM